MEELKQITTTIRKRLVQYSFDSSTPHLGSCLSCLDLLVACYFSYMNLGRFEEKKFTKDTFILSKGHAAPAWFHILAHVGFIDLNNLIRAKHDGTGYFGEHPPARGYINGIDFATGSLGHGLPIAIGVAKAAKNLRLDNKVICLLGDGECNEGSVWEAAALGSGENLQNLTVIIDNNGWQGTDRVENVLSGSLLANKWSAFGWECLRVDGHNFHEILRALNKKSEKPKVIIAKTVKGKGVSFMEDDNNWHYKIPSKEEVTRAVLELENI